MKIMKLWPELEKFAIQFDESKRQIDLLLRYYENNCKILIESIQTISLNESKAILKELFEIQRQISRLKYKYNIEINDFFENFIYYFDRQHDSDMNFLYEHFHQSSNWPD